MSKKLSGVVIFLLLTLTACHNQKNHTNHPLIGAWYLASVAWISDEQTQRIEQAQPALFLFNKSHYSLMWSPKQSPRVPFEDLSNPTQEEILQGFRSIVFNAGTYQVLGNQITATAEVAKVPGFEGGQQFYHFKMEKDKLILTMYDETYPDGSKPKWSGQWETEFTLVKVKP